MNTKTLFIRRLLMLLFISIIAVSSLISQVPYGMKYQAVVRDTWGRIIENKTVGVEIKILQYTEDGSAVFIEEHQKNTNEYGLIYLVIGSVSQQEFINIDWSKGPYYVEIGIDIDGGVNYEQYGTSELLSVPYALYALHAQTADISIDSLIGEAGSGFIANVADYGAVGDGSTNDTEAFNKAFDENTDVFVPSSDNTYIVSNLTIPSDKRIWFEHGAILEVFGLISGNETEIIAGDYQIFTSGSVIEGSWKGGIAYDSWLGNNQQIPGMNAMITSADTTRWGTQIPVLDSVYSEAWNESLEVATRNAIYDKIQSLELSGGSSFIANVVDDYAAIGDGSTDNAQAFENAFAENNDVFVPTAEDNYVISNLNIPSGKRIWFERGAIIDVTGSLSGDTTEIIAGDYQLFTGTSTLMGTWKSGIAFDCWLGNNCAIPGINAMVTSADTTRWGTQIPVLDSAYSEEWDESLEVATRNAIYDKIQSLELSGGSSFIANVVDDYAAIGDGSTDNAQAFENAFIENNDVFVPTAEDNYVISNLNIPSGKRLWFERGAIIDVTGSLSGDTTEIIAGDYQLFTGTSTLMGTWKSGIAFDCWLGNNCAIPGIKAMVTSADTTRWGIQIPVLDSAYSEEWDESIEVATRNAIYDKIQSLELNGGSSFIANVVADYAAIGDGTTDNAQAFSNAFIENNDVFVPFAEENYLISTLSIPHGKRLWFERGAKIDVTGTLAGDTTEIIAGDYQIFTSTSELTGTWKGGIAYDSWFGNNQQIPGMRAMITPADTARWAIDTYGSGSFIANVIDYGALSDGITINDTAFYNALQENNDIFIPGGDSTYLISNLIIPAKKRLWFETDAKIDVKGTLSGDSTEIMAGDQELFTETSTLNGTWKGGISYDSWSGKNEQIPGMVSMVSPEDTLRWGIDTYGSGSFIANVIDYGAKGDGTTNDSAAFYQAFSENNAVFVPNTGYNYKISKLTIPDGKKVWFENGASLDVTGELFIDGEIVAGLHQIFNVNSADKINGLKANIDQALPEWFGAKGDSATMSSDGINKTFQVFGFVDLQPKGVYLINDVLLVQKLNGHGAKLTGTSSFYDSFLRVEYHPFDIRNLTFEVLRYDKMDGGARSDYYYNYVIDFYFKENSYELDHRMGVSMIDNITIRHHTAMGERNPGFWNYSFGGIKTHCQEDYANSYWAKVNNVTIAQADTAIYLTGYEASDNLAMINSWQWSNVAIDRGRCMLYIHKRAKGHVFSNLILQPNTGTNPIPYEDDAKQNLIKIDGSNYNVIDGMIWDIHSDSSLVFTNGAGNNQIGSMGWAELREKFTKETYYQSVNSIGGHPMFSLANDGAIYGDYWFNGRTAGFIEKNNVTINKKIDYPPSPLSVIGASSQAQTPEFYIETQSSAYNFAYTGMDMTAKYIGTSTPATGFGSKISFNVADTNNHHHNLGYLKMRIDNGKTIKSGGGYGSFQIGLNKNGTVVERLNIDSNGIATINDVLKLEPRNAAPPNPTEGMIYVNSSNHHMYCYLGGVWKQLD